MVERVLTPAGFAICISGSQHHLSAITKVQVSTQEIYTAALEHLQRSGLVSG